MQTFFGEVFAINYAKCGGFLRFLTKFHATFFHFVTYNSSKQTNKVTNIKTYKTVNIITNLKDKEERL